ncbi:MAG: TRAP transporter TatT component family protein [Chitinivibrionales bacterium]|nr:TRAP transporter TatT component family protein [Chitinivibrionales bacterium]
MNDTGHSFRTMLLLLMTICFCFTGCVKQYVTKSLIRSLSSEKGNSVFTTDNDPALIADALPFALKTYESLLQIVPNDRQLLIATGKAYSLYAYAFIQSAADTMSDLQQEEKSRVYQRAKNLYLRARNYLLAAFDIRYPGFSNRILAGGAGADSLLNRTCAEDTTALYWTAASWMCAFSVDKFDMALSITAPTAVQCMKRLTQLNESFSNGMNHDFFISYYGSLPASMGGSIEKAREHFNRSVALSKGSTAAPFLALATSVSVATQNYQEFSDCLHKVLSLDTSTPSPQRLATVIAQNKARWLLNHADALFLTTTAP